MPRFLYKAVQQGHPAPPREARVSPTHGMCALNLTKKPTSCDMMGSVPELPQTSKEAFLLGGPPYAPQQPSRHTTVNTMP